MLPLQGLPEGSPQPQQEKSMSEKKAKMAESRDAAMNFVHILGTAAEDGVRSKVSSLDEAQQLGGIVVVLVSVPYRDESGDIQTSQAIVSNCTDQDMVTGILLDVSMQQLVKREAWVKGDRETVQ